MLKRAISYEDFDGNKVTEELYFNISKVELIEMELSELDGLKATIDRIVKAGDMKSLIKEFKKIILDSYGVKSEDGKRFIKSEQLRTEFSQGLAYDALFMDLCTNETAAANFIKGVLPKDMIAKYEELNVPDQPTEVPKAFKLPPQPPMPPSAV
jgi:hypothetical protein